MPNRLTSRGKLCSAGPAPLGPESVRQGGSGTGRTVAYCVRLCDGGHFPLERLANVTPVETCRAMCPASQTKVFYGGRRLCRRITRSARDRRACRPAASLRGQPAQKRPSGSRYFRKSVQGQIPKGAQCPGKRIEFQHAGTLTLFQRMPARDAILTGARSRSPRI